MVMMHILEKECEWIHSRYIIYIHDILYTLHTCMTFIYIIYIYDILHIHMYDIYTHYIHVWHFLYIIYMYDILYILYTCMTFLKTKWNKSFKNERINGNRLLNVLRFIGGFFQFWFLNSSLVVTKYTLYELNVLIFGKTYLQMILFYTSKCCKCFWK